MPASIMIGGDIVPTESNRLLFAAGNREELIGRKLKEKLEGADYTIFNLEAPLTDIENPIRKSGPNLMAPTDTIKGLKAINPHFFTLANNHILDQGEQGLYSTVKLLKRNGVAHAGTGRNLEEAAQSYIKEINGIQIGIYCCAEREFSIATDYLAGANPFDPLESLDHISNLKAETDYVIVLYHGGKEHYRYPSPYLQKVCRKMTDKGADLVVCQHSHCIGCEEKWNGGRIVYGQGNFLFDHSNSEYWQTSLLIEVKLVKDENSHIDDKIVYLPLTKMKNKVRLAEDKQAVEIEKDFRERTEEIGKLGFVRKNYQVFAKEMQWGYLDAFAGKRTKSLPFRVINKLSGHVYAKHFLEHSYPTGAKTMLQNFVECEAHRELLLEGLKGVEAHV
ncbi:MAG: CapA family protein [Dorea sp.]|jgi:poly-gamma-glutamate capsule biosynthesis protein CapA/YwtB (metallophosphatase superfamily)|nr:CapA family protein [Dorea sp.]GFI43487.1 capsule biosynthesis protein CapA [Lachnospiraceae bacterium]